VTSSKTGQLGTKTATISQYKRQSPLTTVVVGHHCSKTANITKERVNNGVSLFPMQALVMTLVADYPIARNSI
jgi:hypothetical protein